MIQKSAIIPPQLKKFDLQNASISHKEDLEAISQFIDTWNVEELSIYYKKEPIIYYLLEVKFPKLSRLALHSVDFQSLESFSSIYMPTLTKLFLNFNKISSVKVFQKVFWPSFHYLSIHGNNISGGTQLTKMQSKDITDLNIEYQKQNLEQWADLRWINKMATCKLQTLAIRSKKRINDPQMDKIKKKYKDLSIYK